MIGLAAGKEKESYHLHYIGIYGDGFMLYIVYEQGQSKTVKMEKTCI